MAVGVYDLYLLEKTEEHLSIYVHTQKNYIYSLL